MTDQELIERLRDEHVSASRTEAADRIEELVKERDEALNQLDSRRHSVDVLEKRLTDKMAKLTKAVEALRESVKEFDCPIARAVLAELEGE